MFCLRPLASRLAKRLALPQATAMVPGRNFAVRTIDKKEANELRGKILRLDLPVSMMWWEEVRCQPPLCERRI
jgi:hypothetical protein